MSKSLIYHYYAAKEGILFDVMHSHVKALLDIAEAVAAGPGTAEAKLRALTRGSSSSSISGAANRQRVLLNELDKISPQASAAPSSPSSAG